MRLADAERVVVTTFAADGAPTASAEFVVGLDDDHVALWTPHVTPWVERLAASDVVSVQAGSRGGRALREEPVLEGRARLVQDGPEVDRVREATRAKYGVQTSVSEAVDWAWELGSSRSPHGVVVIDVVG